DADRIAVRAQPARSGEQRRRNRHALASNPNDVGGVDGRRPDPVDGLAALELERADAARLDRGRGDRAVGSGGLDLDLVGAGGERLAAGVAAVPWDGDVSARGGAEREPAHFFPRRVGEDRVHLGRRAAEVRRQRRRRRGADDDRRGLRADGLADHRGQPGARRRGLRRAQIGEPLVGLGRLFQRRELRQLRHERGAVLRVQRVLVLHLRHEELEELVLLRRGRRGRRRRGLAELAVEGRVDLHHVSYATVRHDLRATRGTSLASLRSSWASASAAPEISDSSRPWRDSAARSSSELRWIWNARPAEAAAASTRTRFPSAVMRTESLSCPSPMTTSALAAPMCPRSLGGSVSGAAAAMGAGAASGSVATAAARAIAATEGSACGTAGAAGIGWLTCTVTISTKRCGGAAISVAGFSVATSA